jgi:formamidopyrimidine-DNA glycosylase
MPELPEVETVRKGLDRLIKGKIFRSVNSDNPKSFPNSKVDVDNFLLGSKVIAVRRRAKVLMIDFASGYTLVIHLKMTGQLVFVGDERFGAGHPNDSLVSSLPDKSTHVEFFFTDDSKLYFNDQRKFGWVKLVPTEEVGNITFMKKLGPEPLEDDFTPAQFIERFKKRSRTSIKAALLDQSVIAGVGNIYADESLWGAKIHPSRIVGSITENELVNLYTEVRRVMNLSIEKGGSTDKNYVDAEGNKGSYLKFANVFRREGQSCPRCGSEIIKLRVAGRGTHICPECQIA